MTGTLGLSVEYSVKIVASTGGMQIMDGYKAGTAPGTKWGHHIMVSECGKEKGEGESEGSSLTLFAYSSHCLTFSQH
jgi:hypothetical protein